MRLRAVPGWRRCAFVAGFALAAASGLALAGCTPTEGQAVWPAPAAAPAQAPVSASEIGAFHWSALAASPLGKRSMPLLAVAGGQLLEFGGLTGNLNAFLGGGAAFDLTTGRWRPITGIPGDAGVPTANAAQYWRPVSAWTGSSLVVANGTVRACPPATARAGCWTGAALYDPGTGQWTPLTPPPQLTGLAVDAVAWTGSQVVLAAADARYEPGTGRLAVAVFAPATGRWQLITPALPSGHPPRYVELAAGGGRLILWSLWDRMAAIPHGFSETAGVDVLAIGSGGTWRNVTGTWPQDRLVGSPVLTSDGVLVSPSMTWCGVYCSPPAFLNAAGYFANPATLERTAIPAGPLGRADPTFVWTGDAIIAVNTWDTISGGGTSIHPGDMALFDPATGRWTALAAAPRRPGPASPPVWTGNELLDLTSTGTLLAFHG